MRDLNFVCFSAAHCWIWFALLRQCFFCAAMAAKKTAAATPKLRATSKRPASKANEEEVQPEKPIEDEEQQESQLAQPEEPANKKRKTEQKGEGNNDDHVEITAEALAKLKGAEDQQVEEFWLKCSTRQQQVLWKKFQSMRKSEGTEIAYQDATKGVGRNGKTKTLMKMWLKHGSSKHPVMIQHMTELRTTDTFRSKEKWLPLESIKQKYGAAELKARVRGGSILVRKSESDPRFPEFRDLSEEKETETQKLKSKQSWLDGKGAWDDFQAMGDLDVSGHFQLEFNNEDDQEALEDDEEQEEEDAQALALSLLCPEETKKGKKQAAVKDALKSFEIASALQDKDSVPAKALVACQKKLQKHLGQLVKKASGSVKTEPKGQLEALAQVKADTPSGVAKKALNAAAAVGKMALKASSEEDAG